MALNEVKTLNGHAEPVTKAWDARLARIEKRLADMAEAGEQRTVVLRDAIGDFVASEMAERDREIVALTQGIADLERKLEQKAAIDQQVTEIAMRLDARQVVRDEAKRGPTGKQGERGARGERGVPGARGPAGKPAKPAVSVHSWHIDAAKFRVTPFLEDGTSLPHLDLWPLFESYFAQTNS
jgi:hypothetical protein